MKIATLYCSESCRTNDWRQRHKQHCKAIRKLKIKVDSEKRKLLESGGVLLRQLTAIPNGKPAFLETGFDYQAIEFDGDSEVLLGFLRIIDSKAAFVCIDEKPVYLPKIGERTSMCIVESADTKYIVTSMTVQHPCGKCTCHLDFYSHTESSDQQCYLASFNTCYVSLNFFE